MHSVGHVRDVRGAPAGTYSIAPIEGVDGVYWAEPVVGTAQSTSTGGSLVSFAAFFRPFPSPSPDGATVPAPTAPQTTQGDQCSIVDDEDCSVSAAVVIPSPTPEAARWPVFLGSLLGRAPTADELSACTRGGVLPEGPDDEQVARVVFDTTHALPAAQDWEHADLTFASTGCLLQASDLARATPTTYCPARSRTMPAATSQRSTTAVANKARVRRDHTNPTLDMIKKSPQLQDEWNESRSVQLQFNLDTGTLEEITEQEASGMFRLHPQWVFKTKRDGTKKSRLATNGSTEDKSKFPRGSIYAPTLPVAVLKYLLASAQYHGMDVHGFDVMAAFPLFNKWDNKACKYPREL